MSENPRIAVIDHGSGNLVSIAQGLERVGAKTELADSPRSLSKAAGVVLPGVGSTGAVMEGLRRQRLTGALAEGVVPLLGICVGMQVLFEYSEEHGGECLGLMEGRVERLTAAPTLPHIGWNDLTITGSSDLYAGISDPLVYFVHSYAPTPSDPTIVTATATHGARFAAGVRVGDIEGVQFHPERSGSTGLRILARFVDRCRRAADAA